MRNILLNTSALVSILRAAETGTGTEAPAPTGRIRRRNKFHAHSDVEGDTPDTGYSVGDELDKSEYVDYLRALYDGNADADTELDDDELASIRDQIEGDTPEADALRIELIERASSGEATDDEDNSGDVSAVRSDGYAIGARFKASLNAIFVGVADSKEYLDGSPLMIAFELEKEFQSGEGDTFVDEMAEWPVPGTSWDDDNRAPDWEGKRPNDKPDHYKSGKSRGSFYADEVDGSQYGKTVRAIRDCFDKVAKNERLNEKEADLLRKEAGIPNWNVLHDRKRRETEDNRWSARRSNVILRLRRARTFLLKKMEVEDVDGVSVQFVSEDMAHVINKREPLYLHWDNGKRGKGEKKVASSSPMALTKFNRLLVNDVAASADGKSKGRKGVLTLIAEGLPPIAAFEKTVERPPRRRKSSAEGLEIPTANVNGKMAFAMLGGLAAFFEDGRKEPARLTELAQHLSGDNSSADIRSMGDTVAEINTFFAPYLPAYNVIKQEDLERIQRETTERLARTGTSRK